MQFVTLFAFCLDYSARHLLFFRKTIDLREQIKYNFIKINLIRAQQQQQHAACAITMYSRDCLCSGRSPIWRMDGIAIEVTRVERSLHDEPEKHVLFTFIFSFVIQNRVVNKAPNPVDDEVRLVRLRQPAGTFCKTTFQLNFANDVHLIQ